MVWVNGSGGVTIAAMMKITKIAYFLHVINLSGVINRIFERSNITRGSWNTKPNATVSIKTNETYVPMVIMGWMPGPRMPIRNCRPKGINKNTQRAPQPQTPHKKWEETKAHTFALFIQSHAHKVPYLVNDEWIGQKPML